MSTRRTVPNQSERRPILYARDGSLIPVWGSPLQAILRHLSLFHESGCWLWTGKAASNGYGRAFFGGRSIPAHRFVYEALVGPIPDGKILCHRCDTPMCVRPSHLFPGTVADNSKDMVSKRRQHSVLTVEQVREIIASDRPASFFAAKFGVHRETVRCARIGKAWRHLR